MYMKSMAAAAALAILGGCVETTTTTVTTSVNRNVLIVNQSGSTVYRFYGSNATRSSWEEDILGSNVLPNGSSVMVDFNDGSNVCTFDFKIQWADGRVAEDYGINVCRISSYTIR
eukprot:TRINITY_DN47811_c0_g1_i1.p1 TRINITY_DN47811_c0_g1~~TRINITY_DN47811_c0_g1_i1.p1  ORF type:complete len:115 (-),score=26.59 TRINITY_DN47811_c0_g1_i1:105-449(-)